MNIFELSQEKHNTFKSIQSQLYETKKPSDFDKIVFWEKSSPYADEDKHLYDIIDPVLTNCYSLLDNLGIKDYTKNKYCLEFQQKNCYGQEKYNWLSWHYDDYGAVNYKVYTVLYYLRKDKTIEGGNLQYKINQNLLEYSIQEKDVLLFKGDLEHCPTLTSGFGSRDLIACFIERIESCY
ncbi:hypothetical protein CPAV1605_1166 [seawater metagenome]|uniref:Prolyl 4-hydroxylase alpha subunit Fe(2+) 2OG dioxygenase domain-containing protein n=1 Tax=seawater metagenome TaxID=1561972 RepID=A0A5E8CLX2_9ZZZZ